MKWNERLLSDLLCNIKVFFTKLLKHLGMALSFNPRTWEADRQALWEVRAIVRPSLKHTNTASTQWLKRGFECLPLMSCGGEGACSELLWPPMGIQAAIFGDTTSLLARSCLDFLFPI